MVTNARDESDLLSAEDAARLLFGQSVGHLVRFVPAAQIDRDEEGIHQVRVTARRLRAILVLMKPALKRKPRRSLQNELRWIGSSLGPQRDLDIMRSLLLGLGCGQALRSETQVIDEIEARLSIERSVAIEALNSTRFRHLLHHLVDLVIDPQLRPSASAPAESLLRPGLEDVLDAFFTSEDALPATPTNRDLHLLRISAKRARYSCDVASTFLGSTSEELAEALAEAQGILGSLHDRFVAIAFINEVARSAGTTIDLSGSGRPEHRAINELERSIDLLRTQWQGPTAAARALRGSL